MHSKLVSRITIMFICLVLILPLFQISTVYAEPPNKFDQEEFLVALKDYIDSKDEDLRDEAIEEFIYIYFFLNIEEINFEMYKALTEKGSDISELAMYFEEHQFENFDTFFEGTLCFAKVGSNVPKLVKYAKQYQQAVLYDDKQSANLNLANAAGVVLSMFEELFATIPVAGNFIAFPVGVGADILERISSLVSISNEHYFRYAYAIACFIIDDKIPDLEGCFMEMCGNFGLENKASLERLRKELQKDVSDIDADSAVITEIMEMVPCSSYEEAIETLRQRKITNQACVDRRNRVYNLFEELLNQYPDGKYSRDYDVIEENGVFKIVRRLPNGDKEIINSESGALGEASKVQTSCPLIIDLDGDGIETTSIDHGVYFDHSGNGFKMKTGWAGPTDGILVRDLNGNSKVDSGKELFGNNTVLKNGKLAVNGFEALKELDINGDGIFDASEASDYNVMIWIDADCNGISTEDELYTFEELGIDLISLHYEEIDYIDTKGNTFKQAGKATRNDGVFVDVIDVWFARDVRYSQSAEVIDISDEICQLPNIRGFGTVYSLHQAMALDESGNLKSLVEEFIQETNRETRMALVKQIIYGWTGTTNHIKIFEKLLGETYTGGTSSAAMAIINAAFERLEQAVYEHLMAASHLKEYYYIREFTEDGRDDLTPIANKLLSVLESDQSAGEEILADFITNIRNLSMLEKVDYVTFRNILNEANPRYGLLADMVEKNSVFTKSGASTLTGLDIGNAFWIWNGGYTIKGGSGDDTYIFGSELGTNTIVDTAGNDAILLWKGVTAEDVSIEQIFKSGNTGPFDIKIKVAGNDGEIIIKDYNTSHNFIIMFSDGSTVDILKSLTYHEIWTSEDLIAVQNDLTLNYKLMADIDLSGIEWQPIGTNSAPYWGIFEGNGYTIKNLNINLPSQDYVGLLGYNKGTVTNVNVEGVTVSGKSYVGSVVGCNAGTIMRLEVSGLESLAGAGYTGGIVGYNAGDLTSCKVVDAGKISNTTTTGYSGGIVGYLNGDMKDCVLLGAESVGGKGGNVGGLAGYVSKNVSQSTVESVGSISGTSIYVGGLVGNCAGAVSGSPVSQIGSISGTSSYVGGLVGNCTGAVSGSSVSEIESISGTSSYVGGLVGNCNGAISDSPVSGIGLISGASDYVGGLVGYCNGAISASHVSEIGTLKNSGSYTGGLAGRSTTITGSSVEGIATLSAGIYAGGLVGASSGLITDSHAHGIESFTGSSYVGGLVGNMSGGAKGCSTTVDVTGTSYVGGLAGRLYSGTIEQCYATGDVDSSSASGTYLGGFAGYVDSSRIIRNSFALGTVPTRSTAGGFAGFMGSSAKLENCYALRANGNGLVPSGTLASSYFNCDYVGAESAGLPGGRTTEELLKQSTYEGWDFGTIWEMSEGGYPTLRGLEKPELADCILQSLSQEQEEIQEENSNNAPNDPMNSSDIEGEEMEPQTEEDKATVETEGDESTLEKEGDEATVETEESVEPDGTQTPADESGS